MDIAEIRRIARSISSVENKDAGHRALLDQAYRTKARPVAIGVTGPPGVGKSTLVDGLAASWSATGKKIAILAVDPSSPYSGGAVLGDRIRRRLSASDNVFFRSLSSRGHPGGVTDTMDDLVTVLRLFDFDVVIIETVGAGQADTEVREIADCAIVVTVGNLGDGIQAAKAGLMEIADIFVINKSDLPGAEDAAQIIEGALSVAYTHGDDANASRAATPGVVELRRRHGDPTLGEAIWMPPVLRLSSTQPDGVQALASAVDCFLHWHKGTGRHANLSLARSRRQVLRALSNELLAPFQTKDSLLDYWVNCVSRSDTNPHDAARAIVAAAKLV